MPWGTSSAVSTRPATRSLRSHAGRYEERLASPGTTSVLTPSRSAERQPLGGTRRDGVGQPNHAEAVGEPEGAGQERNEQGDLQRTRPGVGVDANDLLPHGGALAGQLLGELGVAHHLSVVLERVGHVRLL